MSDHGQQPVSAAGHGDPHAAGGHGHGDSSHGDSSHDDHGHGGNAKYIYVFIALCVLTGCSFFTYSSLWPFHRTPQVGWAFMMAVSCTKAMLVILFFMHVKYEANWKYVLTIPAGFMSIFLTAMLVPDIGLRMMWYSQERKLYMATPRPAEAHGSAQDMERETEGKPHH
jgi:cytochrome c oxidase subunit IV